MDSHDLNVVGSLTVNGQPISGGSGTSGSSGTSGTSGATGAAGTSGTSGAAGAAGTSGTSGQDGMMSSVITVFALEAIDTTAGSFYYVQDQDTAYEYVDFEQTVYALLHMDDTGLTDEIGHTVTKNGTIARSATQSKFGGYSVYFDGNTSNYLSMADSDDWTPSGDFTLDMWVRFDALASTQVLAGHEGDPNNNWVLYWSSSNGLAFDIEESGTAELTCRQGATTGWSVDTWYHVAAVKYGTHYSIYRDGVELKKTISSHVMANFSGPFKLGQLELVTASFFPFKGYMDEVRFTHKAEWTSDFTPPSSAYSGSFTTAPTVDGERVIATLDGGSTRWLGRFGRYKYNIGYTGDLEDSTSTKIATVVDGLIVSVE